MAWLLQSKDEWAKLVSVTAGFTLFKGLGYLPAISDRHLGEFFPFFLSSEEDLRRYHMKRTSVADRRQWNEAAKSKLSAILAGEQELTLQKTRDIVVDVINALAGAGPVTTTVNYPNEGQIDNAPRGAVVETVGRIEKDRVTPLPAGPLPPQLAAVVLPHVLRHDAALAAALEGSRDLFVAALLSDPTTPRLETVGPMADELIEANRDLLPQFR